MKITINIDENVPETEIIISCNQLTEEIENGAGGRRSRAVENVYTPIILKKFPKAGFAGN